eukprot:359817-Chlamydomonas_euryale.AAC.2
MGRCAARALAAADRLRSTLPIPAPCMRAPEKGCGAVGWETEEWISDGLRPLGHGRRIGAPVAAQVPACVCKREGLVDASKPQGIGRVRQRTAGECAREERESAPEESGRVRQRRAGGCAREERAGAPEESGRVRQRRAGGCAGGEQAGVPEEETAGANSQTAGANSQTAGANSQTAGANSQTAGANSQTAGANSQTAGANS